MHLDKLLVLRRYFGHTAFRPGQEQLIDAVLSGQDVMGIMPTGGGKSLCYQVPALLLPGVTLVISPLISLMKDQVSALKNVGIPAAFINSSLSLRQLGLVYERARQGAYKVIYVAPERLEAEGFSAFAKEAAVSLVAVDEAHCISQWGQDFRPSYLKIATFIASLPRRPVVAAFTATATAEVRQDIVRLLQLQKPVCTVTGFDRPNLFFDVLRPKNKVTTLLALLRERNDKTGIVYCATRAAVEKVCQTLCDNGFSATRYHAGLADEERRANQEDFQFDRKQIMVATNAFGMGIDKSNVGFVIHYQMPKSLESYYQEAGRAGRDGAAADCILLFSPGDIETAKFFIANSSAEEQSEEAQQAFQAREYARLRVMVDYCRRTDCLRGAILDYFGQPHEASCGSCGNCKSSYRSEDITVEAQMILSCVLRVKEKLGYFVGKTLIARILTGSRDNILDTAVRRRWRGIMESIMPADAPGAFNQALMDLGAMVCLPGGEPVCDACPAAAFCQARALGLQRQLPVRAGKPEKKVEHHTVFLLLQEGQAALRQRPDTGLLAGLWEYPHVPGTLDEADAARQLEQWGLTPRRWVKSLKFRHLFTHIRWELTGYVAEVRGTGPADWLWADKEQRRQLAIPSAFEKLTREWA